MIIIFHIIIPTLLIDKLIFLFNTNTMKTHTINFLLIILGKSLAIISEFDTNLKDELKPFPENYIVEIKGPKNSLQLVINDNKIDVYSENDTPDLIIGIKNTKTLLNILVGKISIHGAYAENRLIVKGDIHRSIRFVRILYICQAYLFPYFILKRSLKNKNNVDKVKLIKQLLIGG